MGYVSFQAGSIVICHVVFFVEAILRLSFLMDSLLLRLVLPTVRASIENACARVARGEAQKPRVVEKLGKHWNEM